ncbi:unnamed protein product [Caretta caretta]
MNKLLALGFSALLCCVPASMNRIFPSAEVLRCIVCQNKIPIFGCIKGQGICHLPPGLPCKLIRVYTNCTMQSDRCNIMEPTKSGHHQISCCNTDFCNN